MHYITGEYAANIVFQLLSEDVDKLMPWDKILMDRCHHNLHNDTEY